MNGQVPRCYGCTKNPTTFLLFLRASQKGGISDFFFAITCSCVHFLSHSFRIVKSPHPEDIA
nr:MAG TPA: hypothetical protein [Caudoviricetes sp.]